MKRPYKAILFDWDGTLVDTYHSTFRAYAQSLAEFGIELSEQEFADRYTPHWNHFYAVMNLHADHWAKASEKWQYYFQQETIALMPGVRALLESLRHQGYRLGVVTATSVARLQAEMIAFGLEDMFEVWVCDEDVTHKKPHPEALKIAVSRLRVRSSECLLVGDATADVEMAQRARMASCAIPSQFNTVEAIESLQPSFLITSLERLPMILAQEGRGKREEGRGKRERGSRIEVIS